MLIVSSPHKTPPMSIPHEMRLRQICEHLAYMFLVGAVAQIGMALIQLRDGFGVVSVLSVLDPHARPDPVLWASLGAGFMAFCSGMPICWALLSGRGREAAIYAENELLFDLLTPVVLISFYCRYLAGQSWHDFIFPSSAMLLGLQFVVGLQFYTAIRDPNRIMIRQIALAVSPRKPRRLL